MKAKCVGTINLGNEVTISDPCYDSGIWCSITFKNILEGDFKCYIKEKKYGSWGNRVTEMYAIHNDYENLVRADNYEYCGDVCVDSGTMSITDTAYYDSCHSNDDYSEEWYNREVCEATCGDDEKEYNIADYKCFISTSGIGDGQYGVYGAFDGEDKLYAVKIVFLD